MPSLSVGGHAGDGLREKPGAWVDLGLTLPIFLIYHAGVVFLRVQNATDVVTPQLLRIAEGNTAMYLLITAGIGVIFAGVFAALGRGQAFRAEKFVQIALEGVIYAVAMRVVAAYVVGRVADTMRTAGPWVSPWTASFAGGAVHAVAPAAGDAAASPMTAAGPFVGVVMSFGAGFYEELAFRVVLFGLGAKLLVWVFAHQQYGVVAQGAPRLTWRALLVSILWAVVAAVIFSAVHYIGPMGDKPAVDTFLFRMVLGLALTAIFALRGFAAAVWTHALYDVWVLVFPFGG